MSRCRGFQKTMGGLLFNFSFDVSTLRLTAIDYLPLTLFPMFFLFVEENLGVKIRTDVL